MSYLRYLCLFAYKWCPTYIALCFCSVYRRLVYPMVPGSLDCPFLIAPSVFSNVYSTDTTYPYVKRCSTNTGLVNVVNKKIAKQFSCS